MWLSLIYHKNGKKVKVAEVTLNFWIAHSNNSFSTKQPCDWIRYCLSVCDAFYFSCYGVCGLDLDISLPSQCIHSELFKIEFSLLFSLTTLKNKYEKLDISLTCVCCCAPRSSIAHTGRRWCMSSDNTQVPLFFLYQSRFNVLRKMSPTYLDLHLSGSRNTLHDKT